MRIWLAIVTLGCLAAWLQAAPEAVAQNRDNFGTTATQGRDYYNRPVYTAARVSPYVNLGVYNNGLSNYQTLVKPMLDEREAMRLQFDDRQQPRQQARDVRSPRGGNSKSDEQPVVRFMHYSHFYGGIR